MLAGRKYVDFEIVKESWNKYSLKDGSKLKTRVMLESAWYVEKKKEKIYRANIQNFTTLLCDPTLQGTPDQVTYSQEEIQRNVEVEDCRYDTISYEASEYILDDRTRILVHTNIIKISRTSLFSANGDRIYSIQTSATLTITPPSK